MLYDQIWHRDAYQFYRRPVWTRTLIANANQTVSICSENIDRVGLWIVNPSNQSLTVSTTSPISNSAGFFLINTLPPLMLQPDEWGTLSQQEWFAIATAPNTPVVTMELILDRNPDDSGYHVYETPASEPVQSNGGAYQYVDPGIIAAQAGVDFLSPLIQQDYYQLWLASCAGRRRPDNLPGNAASPFGPRNYRRVGY